jgi:hypothetical protein
MVLDLKLVLIAGILWGIIGVILMVVAGLIPAGLLPFEVNGLSLATFTLLFAGVHFVYRNPSGLVSDLIGGAIAGVIAALILILASNFLPTQTGAMTGNNIIGAIAAGIGGALGMAIIERTSGVGR